MREGITTFNKLGGEGKHYDERVVPSAAQRSAISHLALAYGRVKAPAEVMDNLRAWQALQGTKPGYNEEVADTSRVTYQRGRLALPSGRAGQRRMAPLLADDLQCLLRGDSGLFRDPL